jgi:phage shock protein PspC (stress-responsive transcriptional regulator)
MSVESSGRSSPIHVEERRVLDRVPALMGTRPTLPSPSWSQGPLRAGAGRLGGPSSTAKPCVLRKTALRQYVSVRSRPEKETPLARGPLYGLLYCLAGVCAGLGAYAVSGWASVPIWLVAALLFVAGLWTALFTGGWLLLMRWAQRKRGSI